MTRAQTTAARGSDTASTKPVDRNSPRGHHKTTLSGVSSG